jgi:threonine dehydratase
VGAFKARGAANKVTQLVNPSGVCTHSSGNHGQALAYIGKSLNIPVVVVMP